MFIFLLFYILLTFYFLNFLCTSWCYHSNSQSPQVLAGTCKVTFLCSEGIPAEVLRVQSLPPSPCSKLTLAAPAAGLTGPRLWGRHFVSIRYHLAVRAAPARSAAGQTPCSFPASQAPKLYLTGSRWSLEKRRCWCSTQAGSCSTFGLMVVFPEAAMKGSIDSHRCTFPPELLRQAGLGLCLSRGLAGLPQQNLLLSAAQLPLPRVK